MNQSAGDHDGVPTTELLFNPVLETIRELGGSASVGEIESHVIEKLGLRADILGVTIPDTGQPRLRKRLGWARTRLKWYGYLDNKSRGIWALTAAGQKTRAVDPDEILGRVDASRQDDQRSGRTVGSAQQDDLGDSSSDADFVLSEQLQQMLLRMEPRRFEDLCQRILRESGFTDVNVTGRTGDRGIDGEGIIRIGGLVSFPILFQCKRWKGSVGPSVVRDFRGAMQGRADKGLIMTTGTFSYDARKEASRDGVPLIDLVDGDALLDRLKELELGVKVEKVEQRTIDSNWWGSNYGVSLQNGSDEGDE